MALLAVVLCVNFAACSDDENSGYDSKLNIIGIWECIESENDEAYIDVGDYIKFLDSKEFDDPESDLKGKKCVFSGDLDELTNFTEKDWDADRHYTMSTCIYTLIGNRLCIYESDLDRWVGTISIEGDIMIFNYEYENWNADSVTLTDKRGPYVAEFRRVSTN